ncbi:hypothetical protein T439DRAFT_383446 [Meredithblackwellia eburnea MCA 4105]
MHRFSFHSLLLVSFAILQTVLAKTPTWTITSPKPHTTLKPCEEITYKFSGDHEGAVSLAYFATEHDSTPLLQIWDKDSSDPTKFDITRTKPNLPNPLGQNSNSMIYLRLGLDQGSHPAPVKIPIWVENTSGWVNADFDCGLPYY